MNGVEEDKIEREKRRKKWDYFYNEIIREFVLTIIILTIIRRLNLDIMFTEE